MTLFDAMSVSDEVCAGLIVDGLKLAPTRAGNPETESVTLELKPLMEMMPMLLTVLVPAKRLSDDGFTFKSNPTANKLMLSNVEVFNAELSCDETARPTVVLASEIEMLPSKFQFVPSVD